MKNDWKIIDRMSHEEIQTAVKSTLPMDCNIPDICKIDDLAMKLVGKRHEKSEFVDLIRWLLLGSPNVQSDSLHSTQQATKQ